MVRVADLFKTKNDLPLTIRLALVTDVFSTPQSRVALPTTEVFLVVFMFVRRNELLPEYQLVARVTART